MNIPIDAKANVLLSYGAMSWLRDLLQDIESAPVQDSFTSNAARSEIINALEKRIAGFSHFHQIFATDPSWCRNCGRVFRGPITPNVEAICDCSGEKGAA